MSHSVPQATPQQLVTDHLPSVYTAALRLYRELGRSVDLGDLIGFATEGLIDAANRFDPERGASFTTFAYYRIRGAMLDGVRALSPLPRSIWADGDVRVDTTGELDHTPGGPLESGQATIARRELHRRVTRAVARLPTRARRLICDHYATERSLSDAAAAQGISKSWASRLHASALDQLRADLAA